MVAIRRAEGKTESERYLAKLAERSFLDLWSYPNVFVDRRSNGELSDGKELCDLLVVCGDHVLIFSDKSIGWPSADDRDLAWSRWFRRAIKKSADQVHGAERWIRNHPDRLFLDAACTKPFPIDLPPLDRRRVHGIVVALGASKACLAHFGHGSGSLQIIPAIKGGCHTDTTCPEYRPLSIGDVSPESSFIHVFDDVTLDVLLQELDTISDFAEYLDRKVDFVRSGYLTHADGEEDLLAYFLVHTDGDNEHAFVKPDGSPWAHGESLEVGGGTYASMREHPAYIAKKKADEVSYVWDRLITSFTRNIIGGTLVEIPHWQNDTLDGRHELGVRYMALENRMQRRTFGEGIMDALERGGRSDRFARGLLPSATSKNEDTGYIFMLLKKPDHLDIGYEQYRGVRSAMLYGYAINTLLRQPHLKRVIAIGTEPPAYFTGRVGASEDLLYMEMPQWTDEALAEAEKFRTTYDIFKETTLNEYNVHTKEYPAIPEDANLSYSNPIPYEFLHPKLTGQQLLDKERRQKTRSLFKARLLGGTILSFR